VKIEKEGSVRVDLLGGTLDLFPINVILPNVITINVATELKAKVCLSSTEKNEITFISKDYARVKSFPIEAVREVDSHFHMFEEFEFLARVLSFFCPSTGLEILLESGAPPGSGLGGSSAMGSVFFKACCDFFSKPHDVHQSVRKVQALESKILNAGPAGYQDYYPSFTGGILGLEPELDLIKIHQLYTPELSTFLENNISLIYSGETRKSGINNWEVYKGFFDGHSIIRDGLSQISALSYHGWKDIQEGDFKSLISRIGEEGEVREKLFPNILTKKMKDFKKEVTEISQNIGLKVCGAGGGGCFLLTNSNKIELSPILKKYEMKKLNFRVNPPTKE